ncbi:centrosomal protein of 162 kDa isoform X2 [Hyperolius riggenbachi]|uniref:centrosomal protein of 162 kDa isoform X2 n=1 Tax=Hyperolius riggenbachi TaxID=752182 RepID=UPI0035A28121
MAHRLSKQELDEQFEQFLKESLSDDSFDSNKMSSVLENIGKPTVKRPKQKEMPPWWATDNESDDGDPLITSRSFLKSQSASQPIEEVEEEDHIEEMQQSTQDPLITSIEKDSLEIDESVMAYGPSQSIHGVGLDTLEEQEEKERFFAKLEKGASSTIDYSRLNKELDSTDCTQLSVLIRNNEPSKTDDNENKEHSVNYSEDFENDPDALSPNVKNSEEHKDLLENKKINVEEEKHGMLAKVMLLDSVDSTNDTQRLLQQARDLESVTPQGTEAIGTGISNQYTTSDMEALHQAYQNLDRSMEGTAEQRNYLKATDQTSTSLDDTAQSVGKSFRKTLTGDTDISTVDELMQPIKRDQEFGDKFLSQPQSVEIDYNDDLQEKKNMDYLHKWSSGKSELTNLIPLPEDVLQYRHNESVNLHNHSEQQFLASKEPSHSEFIASHQGERHGLHTNKMVKSPTSVLKKGQNAHYAHVKSSGYGKISISTKPPTAIDSFHSTEFHMEKKAKLKANRNLQKEVLLGNPISVSYSRKRRGGRICRSELPALGILSATRTIRFAEDSSFPEDTRTSSAAAVNLDYERISALHRSYGVSLENESVYTNAAKITGDLTVLQRLQNVEEQLKAGHAHTPNFKEALYREEGEFKVEMENVKVEYEEEMKRLKQENYMLKAKLYAEEEKTKKRSLLFGDQKDPEKMQQIKQEIEEQETLLKGYQQENERLYRQVKELHFKNKQNEEHMFKENELLKADLIALREKLNSTTRNNQQASSRPEFNDQSFTELIAELRTLQKRETTLLDDITRYKQEKQALEVDLMLIRKERDLLKTQVSNTSEDKSYEMKVMEEGYKQEINRLNKRLQWFAENQEILDKDAGRLRDAYDQIEKLKLQVEKLTQDSGNQYAQQQKRLKDRAADAKRIQDLERQVKEMEVIIKRRHPNSIPAIMFAAAAVSETDSSSKTNMVSLLEKRIQRLESDLENKDEEAKKSLRSMEQQFQKVKIQYESRIKELEELLSQKAVKDPQKPLDSTIKVKALEQELSIFKDAHHFAVLNLQKEIERLKEKNLFLESKQNGKVDEAMEQSRLTKLNEELMAKRKEIQQLSKTVERLQKERMIMLSSKTHSNSQNAKGKNVGKPAVKGNALETESFPALLDEKLYQPNTFADFHISDLQLENERLQTEIYRLSQEISQQKTQYETSLANTDDAIKRLKQESAEQFAALQHSHQREMEKLICHHALEHSSSRVAELNSKVSTQEVLIKHLQKQVSDAQKDRESLAVVRIREETLQREVTKLLDELKTARECHTPEMKHFLTLESKIKHMEIRHSQREQELHQIILQTNHAADSTQARETDKWKKLVQQKNIELEKFRSELDAILNVLSVLQRQGTIIPTVALEGSDGYRRT